MTTHGPVQTTQGSCKLTVIPTQTGPHIELTDYETDITWISGRVYVRAFGPHEAGSSQIGFQIREIGSGPAPMSVSLLGELGPALLRVTFWWCCGKPPILSVSTELVNPGDGPFRFDMFRVGLTWSPSISWWQYWSYWHLAILGPSSLPSPIPEQEFKPVLSRKFHTIRAKLEERKRRGKTGMVPLAKPNAGGWLFTDDTRYCLARIRKRADAVDCPCPMDIAWGVPAPTFILGGAGSITSGTAQAIEVGAGRSAVFNDVLLSAGTGGWAAINRTLDVMDDPARWILE